MHLFALRCGAIALFMQNPTLKLSLVVVARRATALGQHDSWGWEMPQIRSLKTASRRLRTRARREQRQPSNLRTAAGQTFEVEVGKKAS